jgi:hypothetical protein
MAPFKPLIKGVSLRLSEWVPNDCGGFAEQLVGILTDHNIYKLQ